MNQFNNSRILYDASLQTNHPGNERAGEEEVYSDPRVINNPYDSNQSDFHANLALSLPESVLQTIGNNLSEAIRNDNTARQRYLQIITEYINYRGIGLDKARTAQPGKSLDIYGPTLNKLVLMNASKFHSNLFPVNNLISCDVYGQPSDKIENQANRMGSFANYMVTDVMTGYRDDKRQGLTAMVGEGQFFSKVMLDRAKNKPTANWIRTEDIIIEPNAKSIYDAERVTHQYFINPRVANDRMRNGEWKTVDLESYDISNNVVKKKTGDKLGVVPSQDDSNKQYCIHECQTFLDLTDSGNTYDVYPKRGRQLPYIVSKDKESNNIIGIWRNWNMNDPLCRPIHRITQYKYFTGDGPYGYGLAHFAIGLAKCETQVLQQLLKAGEIANNPAYIMSAVMKNEKSQMYAEPGAINQVNVAGKDLGDAIQVMPSKEPSAAYLQMLTEIISPAMSDISGVMSFDPDNMPANATATLVSAIVNTSHILEDGVMGGLYESFSQELKLLFNVFNEWLPYSPFPFSVQGGAKHITKEDFSPCVQIRPSIDPNASSNMQQMALGEALLDLSSRNPDLYDLREVNKFVLKSLKVKDIESLLVPAPKDPPPPPELDFISEYGRVMSGEAIKVYPGQDHDAHEVGHDDQIARLQADETVDNTDKIAVLQAHNSEHKSFKYLAEIQALMGKELPPQSEIASLPETVQNKISVMAAKAIKKQQDKTAKDNPPPVDPNVVMMKELEVKEKELLVKQQKNEQDTQLAQIKMQDEKEQKDIDTQIKLKEIAYKEGQLALEKLKLEMQHQEMMMKQEEAMAKIQLQKEEMHLDNQTKSYESTLKFENDSRNAESKLQVERDKMDLETQGKAYADTLDYKSNNKEEGVENINNE